MSEVVYMVASSLDGYIAAADGGVGWLEQFGAVEDFGFEEFWAGIGAVLMGRRTFDQSLTFGVEWPYKGVRSYVLTRRTLPADLPGGVDVAAVSGEAADVLERVRREQARPGDVWLLGGSESARPFFQAGLVDRLDLALMPITLGAGVPLFAPGQAGARWTLAQHKVHASGVVQLLYRRVKA